jgi:hypothetical protein
MILYAQVIGAERETWGVVNASVDIDIDCCGLHR